MIQLQIGAQNGLDTVASFVCRAVSLLQQNCNLNIGESHETQNYKPEVGLG